MDSVVENPDIFITVKELLPTQDEADREVERLNALNAGKDGVYPSLSTRRSSRTCSVEPRICCGASGAPIAACSATRRLAGGGRFLTDDEQPACEHFCPQCAAEEFGDA